MFKLNSGYKILSPSGFVNFSGIQKVYKPFYHHIIFDDNTEIKCSNNHPFGEDKITAENLKLGDVLNGKKIVYNEIVEEGIWLYDPLDVEKGNLYYANNIVSHNCEFLGSVDTLISASKLKTMVYEDPIHSNKGLDVYTEPVEDHNYVITVDVAEGGENDYSAFMVIDVSEFPHKQVAKYKNNTIVPMLFPSIIERVAKQYNHAWVLVEINSVGAQVSNILHFDLEYDNVLMTSMMGRSGQVLGAGFSGRKAQLGVRMTSSVKKIGCSNLKTIIEANKLVIKDYDTISELTTFIHKRNTFMAEEGCNDDLSMCLVTYSWLVAQDYFKEMTSNDIRKKLYDERENQIDQDMAPFGFILDGVTDDEPTIDKQSGDRWLVANDQNRPETFELWNVDEYGDKSYMWDYL